MRGGVERRSKDFTLPKGWRYSVLGVGRRTEPLVKFRIDWETRTVQCVTETKSRD